MQIWIDEICSGRSKEIRREFLKFECLNRTQTDILYLFEDCHLLLAVFDLWQFIPDSVTWKRAPFWLGSAHLQSQKRLIGQFSYQNMVEVKTTPLLLKFTINILWAKWMSNPSKMLRKTQLSASKTDVERFLGFFRRCELCTLLRQRGKWLTRDANFGRNFLK